MKLVEGTIGILTYHNDFIESIGLIYRFESRYLPK